MAYTKQGFVDFDKTKPLKAEQLIAMEDGIIANEKGLISNANGIIANENRIESLNNDLALSVPQIYNHVVQKKAQDEQIKILCFGSSWFLNTWFYLNKITSNLGINAKIHGYYMGHSQFDEWIAFYKNDLSPFAGSESTRQAYQYISENGADYTSQKHVTGGTFGDQEYRDAWYNDLISEEWDIIAFQQGAHQSVKWVYWENYSILTSIIKRHCNPNTVIAFNNTWCPSITSKYLPDDTDGLCENTLEGQKKWHQLNWNNCKRMMNLTGILNVSPNGAMIYTMRRDEILNTDDYDLMYDGLHPDNGLTMYGVSCCFYETFIAPFYGISIKNCTWIPNSSSQRSPFNNSTFRAITTEQQAKIFTYVKWSLANRFGYNELDGTIETNPDSDGSTDVDEEGYMALPISHNSLGVTPTNPGRVIVSSATSGTRMSTADETDANGILVGANNSIVIKGLTSGNYPLRVDYAYTTSAGPNPTEAWDAVVGLGNGGDTSNYFPLNADGSNDSITITNTYGGDYYFFFAFAGVEKSEILQASTYSLKYKINEA